VRVCKVFVFIYIYIPGVVACACNPATRRLGLEDHLRTGALHLTVLREGVGQPGIMAKPNPYPCVVRGDQGCVRKGSGVKPMPNQYADHNG